MGNYIATIAAAPTAQLATAQPLRTNLFDVVPGIDTMAEKPRVALQCEVLAYLVDLARMRGIIVPETATISEAGIYDEGQGYILSMPGYGFEQAVIMEELDEAGEVSRTSRIGIDKRGCIGLKADAVRKVCAIPKVRKARKPAAAAPVVEVEPVAAPVEPVAAVIAPEMPVEPVSAAPVDVDALTARLAALEAIVARLARPVTAGKRVRSEAERRAIIRAWRYRCEARARADLDRRALEAANGAYRGLLDTYATVTRDRDGMAAVADERRKYSDVLLQEVAALYDRRHRTAKRLVATRAAARASRALFTVADAELMRLAPVAAAITALSIGHALPVAQATPRHLVTAA